MQQGTDLIALDEALLEHFNPGDRVQVLLGISQDLSEEELEQVALKMRNNGLGIEKFTFGPSTTWPYSLTFEFTRPSRQGYGFIPVMTWLVSVVGMLTGPGILGWELTKATRSYFTLLQVVASALGLAYILHSQSSLIPAARTR